MREAGEPITTISLNTACPHCGNPKMGYSDTEVHEASGLRISVDEGGDVSIIQHEEGPQGVRIGFSCGRCGEDTDLIIGAKADWEQRCLP